MPKLKPGTVVPTDAEDREIAAGIAADPDAREWTDEDFAGAALAAKTLPEVVEQARRGRGPQKAPTKEPVKLRLDPEVLRYFRATGPGWQTRINETLRKAAGLPNGH